MRWDENLRIYQYNADEIFLHVPPSQSEANTSHTAFLYNNLDEIFRAPPSESGANSHTAPLHNLY